MSAEADLSLQSKGGTMPPGGGTHPLRLISFGDPAVSVDRRADGTTYLRPLRALPEYPVRITDRLHHWASATPDRVFMAERDGDGSWRKVTYVELLKVSRHIASGLLSRGLSAERPLLILSGNSIDHALVAFGALYAGVPYCPVSPAYSLISKDYGKLSYLMKLLTPGLVFADDAAQFAATLQANVGDDTEIVASRGVLDGRAVTRLAELAATPLHPGLDAAHEAIGPDTIAKFLLTSGSTGNPKPVPGGIEETVRNLREISPTVYFNVPKGYESLLPYLRDDVALRDKFFGRLHAMFFSGAALAPHIWNGL